MLQIEVPLTPEYWDEEKEQFIGPKIVTLRLEHSLVSLSKWESKWCKAFLSQKNLSDAETMDYIKCMTITPNVESDVYDHLTQQNINDIVGYIAAPMTATTVRENGRDKPNHDVVTSELIYHWMIEMQIPFECQKWHLNRLITLIKVRGAKTTKPKPMTAAQRRELNAARRAKLHSKG